MKPTAMLASIRSSEEEAFVHCKLFQLNIQIIDEQFVYCEAVISLIIHFYYYFIFLYCYTTTVDLLFAMIFQCYISIY